ncbi:hypothetical protein EVAR_18639_1 [Eumeta japonica]|uniref:Uncharacterized protein n=1 Tax=Eumeta variegata TaxID=151549 RepID=A0A4C1U6W1_EUMVA|nr:hypothetical protein EVAR_18639_1 [Eumeta japonica]
MRLNLGVSSGTGSAGSRRNAYDKRDRGAVIRHARLATPSSGQAARAEQWHIGRNVTELNENVHANNHTYPAEASGISVALQVHDSGVA